MNPPIQDPVDGAELPPLVAVFDPLTDKYDVLTREEVVAGRKADRIDGQGYWDGDLMRSSHFYVRDPQLIDEHRLCVKRRERAMRFVPTVPRLTTAHDIVVYWVTAGFLAAVDVGVWRHVGRLLLGD